MERIYISTQYCRTVAGVISSSLCCACSDATKNRSGMGIGVGLWRLLLELRLHFSWLAGVL